MDTKGLKHGDYIRAYHKGIHQVIAFFEFYQDRTDGGSCTQVSYKKVVNDNMTIPKSHQENQCHIDFCTKVSQDSLRQELAEKTRLYNDTIKYLAKNGCN